MKQFCVLTKVDMGGSETRSTSTRSGDEEADGIDRMMELVMDALEHYAAQRVRPSMLTSDDSTSALVLNPEALRLPSLPSKEVARVNAALEEAALANRMFCVVHRFTLIQAQYRLYEAPVDYEALRSEHLPERMSLEELALDMLRHEWHYREVAQLCEYLRRRRVQHTIYRRGIVMLGGSDTPLHAKTPWWESVFSSERAGFYYAVVVVNLGTTALAHQGDV